MGLSALFSWGFSLREGERANPLRAVALPSQSKPNSFANSLKGELSPQATERFRHNYTVSLIKMQSHRGHLGKLLFKRMAELGGVQAADQLDPGALHHKTFMGQGEQSPHIQQRGIPHREP